MSFFNKKTPARVFENKYSNQGSNEIDKDGVLDVDAIMSRRGEVTNDHPKTAEGWHKKLNGEDEHFRNIKS